MGWLNFRHDQPSSPNGIVLGDYFVSGFAYGANIGWINLGTGYLVTDTMTFTDTDGDGDD